MSITKQRLDEIKSRSEAATDGPWRVADDYRLLDADGDGMISSVTLEAAPPDLEFDRKEDAAFIANARTDVPDLVAEVERLREIIDTSVIVPVLPGSDDADEIVSRALARIKDVAR